MILICGRSRSTPPVLISPMAITAGALGGARLPHRKKDEDSSSARRQPGFLMQSQCGEHFWAEDRETISCHNLDGAFHNQRGLESLDSRARSTPNQPAAAAYARGILRLGGGEDRIGGNFSGGRSRRQRGSWKTRSEE